MSEEARQEATGQVIKSLREDNDLTLEQLGSLCGLGASHLCQVEKGKKRLSFSSFFAVIEALNIDESEFMKKVKDTIPQLLAEKKKRIDGRSFHEEMISMRDLLDQVEKEAKRTDNTFIEECCATIRKLFPEWLSAETIDDYIQKEIPESPSSFSPQKTTEV